MFVWLSKHDKVFQSPADNDYDQNLNHPGETKMNKVSKQQALVILNWVANSERLRAEQSKRQTITPSVGVYGQMFRRGGDMSRLIHESRTVAR